MRVTFVLPAPIRIPMGGVKVVYAHAAGLAALGHEVVIACPSNLGGGVKGWAMSKAIRVRDRFHHVTATPYYAVDGVETLIVPTIKDRYLPEADIIIATGVQTAPWVRDLSLGKGAKAYFLQHVETFIDPQAIETWHYPLAKITIARWIERRVVEAGGAVIGVVPNAIDPTEFFLDRSIEERETRVVALYHRQAVKGPDVLIAALGSLKARVPGLQADVFSARPPSHKMPPWVNIHIRPSVDDLRAMYNKAAVVWSTSSSEGWGLVTMEAAACGCAVVASANEGIQEYLVDGLSAKLVEAGNAEALAEETQALFQNAQERQRLALAGMAAVRQFSWAESTAEFERILVDNLL